MILALRPGEVVTYGDIAEDAGYPKRSRLVGRILATTEVEVPWWRVVNSAGRLVPGHERTQQAAEARSRAGATWSVRQRLSGASGRSGRVQRASVRGA